MKIFCTLLLIGIIAYVECDPDDCDKYAVNTYEKSAAQHSDHQDQWIKLDDFVKNKQSQHFVTRATPSNVPGSDKYCSGPTHGPGCKAVGYWRKITEQPPEKSQKGANLLKFDTVFVAETGHDYAIKYEMTIEGVNEDDYIFKFYGNPIKATKIDKNNKETDVSKDIASGVVAVLQSKFALVYAKDDYALYMTCDAKTMWVSYNSAKAHNQSYKDATKKALDEQIQILKDKVTADKKTPPELIDISTEILDVYGSHIPDVAAAA